MCREFILNLKEAPAPKPAGKGVKQATGATPLPDPLKVDPAGATLKSSATNAPDSSAAEAASLPASLAAPQATAEEVNPSAGESNVQGEAADITGRSLDSANAMQEQPESAEQAAEAANG